MRRDLLSARSTFSESTFSEFSVICFEEFNKLEEQSSFQRHLYFRVAFKAIKKNRH